ncbi:hypothetical protein VTJ04DRAFT_7393 [Mycothermus thermophilus]|uniref:uncharacterized protein n=1 Tax=Humicola insolens TaxID=85995 RepID=UPI003743A633
MAYNHLSISELESLIKDLKGYKSIGASIGAKPSTSTKTVSELSVLSDAELLARINKFESSRISSKKKNCSRRLSVGSEVRPLGRKSKET